jgi:hypothetical protein
MSRRLTSRKPDLLQSVAAPRPVEVLGMSIAEFCQAHGFSENKYYMEARAGRGPDVMKIGARTIITREAAARWREQRTAESIAAKAAKAAAAETIDAIPKQESAKVAKPRLKASFDIERARAEIAEARAVIERASAAIEKASA